MRILVLNCGSSSIKYQFVDVNKDIVLAQGIVGKIGESGSYIHNETATAKIEREVPIADHASGLDLIIKYLTDREHGVIRDLSEISAVGHRVVHGGEAFTASTLITEKVLDKIRECIPLAPLHNPHNLAGIEAVSKLLPTVPQVAIFDTSFHQTLPEKAFLYPIPYELYEKYKVRKYGFHGTSCRYVSQRAAEILGRPLNELKTIVCHLGNGVTVDAISDGKSVDTSMGLTPVEGLMMGTRSGDVDPGVIYYLSKVANLSIDEIYNILNTKSGLLGISGVSNDMREIIKQADAGNKRCQLAIDMFAYRIRKYIGACAAVLGGADALVFTAGIGENSPLVRSMICEGLDFLGVSIDPEKNNRAIGSELDISSSHSNVRVLVIHTNEERMIALDTMEIVSKIAQKEIRIK
ncbi:MAG: acetate kinase [Nitrososphaerota archaeon]|nr:acetate kinase [Nitrososphaerota archaeon]